MPTSRKAFYSGAFGLMRLDTSRMKQVPFQDDTPAARQR